MKKPLHIQNIGILLLTVYTVLELNLNQVIQAQTTYPIPEQAANYPLKTQISPAEIAEFQKIFEIEQFKPQKSIIQRKYLQAIALRKRLQPLADKNDPVASYLLAKTYDWYQLGIGDKRDSVLAIKWYLQAAKLNYAPAAYFIYLAYLYPLMGLQKDEAEASKWLHKAKELAAGSLKAKILLDFVHFSDHNAETLKLRSLPKSTTNYLEYLRQAYALSPRDTWIIHRYGDGLYEAKRYTEALSVLIHSDNAYIWQKIGKMYEQGLGTSVDIKQALFWYKKMALEGKEQENEINPISLYGRQEIYRLICLKKITIQQAESIYSPEKYWREFGQFSDSKCNYGS